MKRKITNYIVIHCSATPPHMDIGAETIRRWHKDRGWSDIGYHFVISQKGTLELGRPVNAVGAHVKGHNHESVGICMVGGVDGDGNPSNTFVPNQFLTLFGVVKYLKECWPMAKVLGHRDFPGVTKACPSFDAREWFMDAFPGEKY